MDSWRNGAQSSEVKSIIDKNFDILDKRTIKINGDISKLIDNGGSELNSLNIEFVASNWIFADNSKTYVISIPYSDYNRENPCVEVYIKNEDDYSPVYGGYKIGKYGIDLQSDMPYEGRVVIK